MPRFLLARNILPVPSFQPHGRLPDPSPQWRHRCRLAASDSSSNESGRDGVRPDSCGESAAREPSNSGTGSASDRPGATTAAEEAATIVAACVDLMCLGRLDELLDHLPDAVIDRCIQHRKAR